MPPDAQHVTVLRFVVRAADFAHAMAKGLFLHLDKVMRQLDALPSPKLTILPRPAGGTVAALGLPLPCP
ncbi:hypothetical protein EJB05_06369, partial [Eragrostis curvula]